VSLSEPVRDEPRGAPQPLLTCWQLGSEGWTRTKQGFSMLWKNWGLVREIQARRKKGEDITLNEYCMVARDKKDTGKLIRGIGGS